MRFFNFTSKEKTVIFILMSTLFIGTGIDVYKYWGHETDQPLDAQAMNGFEKDILAVIAEDTLKEKRSGSSSLEAFWIDINTAMKPDFEKLPHVGPVLSQKIIDYRNTVGRFKTVDDLLNVKGIGKVRLAQLKPYLKIANQ